MSDRFDATLLGSGELMRRAGTALINNAGRAIALITLTVAALVTFTDVSLADFGAKSFTAMLAVMLIASYLIYFSMADAGEKAGEESEEYRGAMERYLKLRDAIGADKMGRLREFCAEYARAELHFRRETLIASYGFEAEAFALFDAGRYEARGRERRIFKKARRMRAVELTPTKLLSRERSRARSELSNPESYKLLRLALRLIPTTLGMLLTVSIIPSVKENMGTAAVIEGIIKLSGLPVVGFRGYCGGYLQKKRDGTAWLETKARLFEAFLAELGDAAKP